MQNTALILFAHGARDPDWAKPIRQVQAAIQAQAPAQPVELAFLEFMSPTLEECASHLAEAGATRIVIVPMFIAQGGHLKRDVPVLVERLRERYPACSLVLTPPVGEAATVISAMAGFALAQA